MILARLAFVVEHSTWRIKAIRAECDRRARLRRVPRVVILRALLAEITDTKSAWLSKPPDANGERPPLVFEWEARYAVEHLADLARKNGGHGPT